MANAILLNQSTNLTKDNILDTLNKSVISDITFDKNNNKLTIKYVDDDAENKEIILPLDTLRTDIDNKITQVTGIQLEGKIPQLTKVGQLSATNILASQIVTISDSDLSYEPI